jgi:hypothetical protein
MTASDFFIFFLLLFYLPEHAFLVLVEVETSSTQEKRSKKRVSCAKEGISNQLFLFFIKLTTNHMHNL